MLVADATERWRGGWNPLRSVPHAADALQPLPLAMLAPLQRLWTGRV